MKRWTLAPRPQRRAAQTRLFLSRVPCHRSAARVAATTKKAVREYVRWMLASPQKLGPKARRSDATTDATTDSARRRQRTKRSAHAAAAAAAEKRLILKAIDPVGTRIVQSFPRRM